MLIVEKILVEEEPTPEGTTETSKAESSPKGTTETPETPKSKPANNDIQEFENNFIYKFYKQKDKKGAIDYLNDYMENGGTIRKEFISVRYDDIYKVRNEIARSAVVNYLEKDNNLGASGKNLADVLKHKNPKFVNDFVHGMSFGEMSNPNNVFMNLMSKNDNLGKYKNILSNEKSFSKLFNLCSANQSNSGFNEYSAKKDCIISNGDLYDKVPSDRDIKSLVDYDMNLTEDEVKNGARTNLNNAITAGDWKSYAMGQVNKEKEAEREKEGSKKQPKQLADEFYSSLKGKNPNDVKEVFTNLFRSIGLKDPEAVSKSIVNAIFPK